MVAYIGGRAWQTCVCVRVCVCVCGGGGGGGGLPRKLDKSLTEQHAVNNAASLEQGMARHTYAYRVFIRNLDPFKFPYPSPQVTRTLEPLYSGHHRGAVLFRECIWDSVRWPL